MAGRRRRLLGVIVAGALAPGGLTAHDALTRSAVAAHCRTETVTKIIKNAPVATTVEVCDAEKSHEPAATTPAQPAENDWPSSCEYWADQYGLTIGEDFQCGFYIEQLDDEQEQLTPGRIRRALESFEVPAPELVIEPPDGRTLVNFDTNFYTEADVLHRSTTLLGQAIEFRIIPQSYRWTFGDGAEETTTSPGARYPALEVTHRYLRKGTYRPRLTTTYDAEYRLGGGSWRAVPGSLTLTDAPQQLEAVTARPILVAPDGS